MPGHWARFTEFLYSTTHRGQKEMAVVFFEWAAAIGGISDSKIFILKLVCVTDTYHISRDQTVNEREGALVQYQSVIFSTNNP